MTYLVATLAPDLQYGPGNASGSVALTPHTSKPYWWRVDVKVSDMAPGDYPSVLVVHIAEDSEDGDDTFASTVRTNDDGTGATRFMVNDEGDGIFVGYFSTSQHTEDPYLNTEGVPTDRRIVNVTVMGRYPDENLYGTFV